MHDSFHAKAHLDLAGHRCDLFRLAAVAGSARLPFSLKILLENLLRHEDGVTVTREDIEALAQWDPQTATEREIQYRPARVLMQDFTGVPAVVDLAAMREAMGALGGDPERINPLQPAELVIDHSVQVDHYGSATAASQNTDLEFARNHERYRFLKWGQQAFTNFNVVPPGTGIVHQVNVEHLARVVFTRTVDGITQAYPDTLVGTDSHTTMINGLGILGWGVGGIEAEASMLGQPISMLIPPVVGMKLSGQLPVGVTATDLVLTIVERLRAHGVVGKFVEFFGPAIAALPMGDRTTIANMAPEYGATCGLFPIDEETLAFLRLTGRDPQHIALVEAYAREQGLFATADHDQVRYSEQLELDISTIEPSLAGPRRPQDRVALRVIKPEFDRALHSLKADRGLSDSAAVTAEIDGQPVILNDGAVVIAAITSCTNTSNPGVMLAAGLLARNAVQRGLHVPPWVKTSLGPGSLAVTRYLQAAGLMEPLQQLGFHVVGYGCTTCIGNSGPLRPEVSAAIAKGDLTVVSVLSGNRNFEGRVHAEVRMNYLASPPLVVAYALAGRMNFDPQHEPIATDAAGQPVYLHDLWPSRDQVAEAISQFVRQEDFAASYATVFEGNDHWQQLAAPSGQRFTWEADSSYIRHPPYFEGMTLTPEPIAPITGARCLALLGDSVTTDHISPAGAIKTDSPAGQYLIAHGIAPADFNSYGSRRGNHEVMMRGTFANIRLRNRLAPGTEGGITVHQPSGEQMSIYDAAMRYQAEQVPAIILAGKEYGSGSSRDWAAKGPRLLGVRAVIAESYERIHRTNLVCMGILPLQFAAGESAASLGLTGEEHFDIDDVTANARTLEVCARRTTGEVIRFTVRVRIDTPNEMDYYRHGGILHYVLRRLAGGGQ